MVATMAKKKNDKPGPWDNIARGMNTAGKVVYEVSGAGDVSRFARNPSWANARNLGLTVASYAAGPVAKAAVAAKAGRAALAAEKAVLATTKAKVARPIADKTMTFTKKMTAQGRVGVGSVTTQSGKKLPVTGMASASTPKNPNRVIASRVAAVNQQAEKAGRAASKQVTKKGSKKVVAGYTAGAVVAGGKGSATIESQRRGSAKKK